MSQIQNRDNVALLGAPSISGPVVGGSFGGLVVSGNTTTLSFFVSEQWEDLDLDLIAILSTNTMDWILSDQQTGELTYQGSETFRGLLLTTITMASASGGRDFRFRAVKNGSPIESVRMSNRISATPQTVPYITPLTVTMGATIRMQMAVAIGGGADITDMSMQAYPVA